MYMYIYIYIHIYIYIYIYIYIQVAQIGIMVGGESIHLDGKLVYKSLGQFFFIYLNIIYFTN